MDSNSTGEQIANVLNHLFKQKPLPNELKSQKKRWKDGILGEKAQIRIVEKYTCYRCKIMCYGNTNAEDTEVPDIENNTTYKYKIISYVFDKPKKVEKIEDPTATTEEKKEDTEELI